MKSILVAALAASLAVSLHAAEVKIIGYQIPGVVETDKSGTYDKIVAKIAADTNSPVNYTSLPAARAEDEFKRGHFDCIFPLDARFWTNSEKGKLINSEPINVAKIYIFSKAGEGPYTSLEPLKGKVVGLRRGFSYGPKTADSGVNFEEVTDDDQNVYKLKMGRISAFMAYVPDMWFWAKDKNQSLPNHDASQPFETHKDAFLCRGGPATEAFIKTFDAGLIKLRNAGELKSMLGETYVP